jgi:S-DNA-T family DNA segregation ATPase FtsK/SpoIIIE
MVKSVTNPSNRRSGTKKTFSGVGLTLDQKLDIIGVVLALLGILLLAGLLFSTTGSLTGEMLGLVHQGFGWGGYLLPIALLAVGLWLVLRRFERIPQVSLERILGIVLLFGNLLGIFHFLSFPKTPDAVYALAQEGSAGGYGGALIYSLLHNAFGTGGMAIALLAWLLIALTLTLNVPVVELFSWIPPLVNRVQDAWDDYRTRRNNPQSASFPTPATTPKVEFQPSAVIQ